MKILVPHHEAERTQVINDSKPRTRDYQISEKACRRSGYILSSTIRMTTSLAY